MHHLIDRLKLELTSSLLYLNESPDLTIRAIQIFFGNFNKLLFDIILNARSVVDFRSSLADVPLQTILLVDGNMVECIMYA